MDIEKLKLTDGEIRTIQNDLRQGWAYVGPEHVASAQLAKALWGLVDILYEDWMNTADPHPAFYQVRSLLETAGIPRPQESGA